MKYAEQQLRDQMLLAAEAGDIQGLQAALSAGAKIDTTRAGDSALKLVCVGGHSEALKYLIKEGADVNLADDDGETPLMHAAHRGKQEIVEILLAGGAEVNKLNFDDISALDRALWAEHQHIVGLLKAAGATE